MTVYLSEDFTPAEADILRRYFTNLRGPVFALVNLPELVKSALFARYAHSAKSFRRLFLDEFVGELDISGDVSIDATTGMHRAKALYDPIFAECDDDSVAQLGGVHLVCERASNLLTNVLEWGRLASYIEQSARHVSYDVRLGGRYRYHRDPEVLRSPLGLRYVGDLDRSFDRYGEMATTMTRFFRDRFAKQPGDSDLEYRQAIKAQALDAVRGVLPAATLANVGIYASGQAYESLLLQMLSHPLPEARRYADLMLTELRKVIPSFLENVDIVDRGVATSTYLVTTRATMEDLGTRIFGTAPPPPDVVGATDDAAHVELIDFDPDAETKLVASMLYPHTHLSGAAIEDRVREMTFDERVEVIRAYVGQRPNRRDRPGRAFKRPHYRFDVLADHGAFGDLQRQRMSSIEWQPFSTRHGFTRPSAIEVAGLSDRFDEEMERSASLHNAMSERFPVQAAYAVAVAYRIRVAVHVNAREAIHLIELRSGSGAHWASQRIAQQMHRLIAEQAGHRAIAEAMRFVDHTPETTLERLAPQTQAERRRMAP